MDKKQFGSLVYPHLDYYNFTLPSFGTWNVLVCIITYLFS